ncbi:oligosaccharide flippase family protein [Porphyromonas sp. COT-290 OH3588]|uniref:polysaccharide biosynthesis C-terminal domain-containing protein n=1 Tax=Porphyromonas sp. COT-290 OH3588 TaxID=1515617 RepID=UPI00052BC64A|nr:oligosaccharide flippase family protein [Porphyromonas sp. COT-290 OH3588]KGO01499.1 hypothetical protein HQ48_01575 [Porphyromonas sp. COT-290 OH3588]
MANIVAQESLKGTIVTYIGVAVGFLTTFFILTNYLTPEEVGLTRLLVEVATLLSGFGLLGLTTSISRFFPYFYDEASLGAGRGSIIHHGFFRHISLVALLGSCITLPLYYLLREPITALFERNSAMFVDYYLWVIPLTLLLTLWTISELYSIQLLKLFVPKTIRELILRLLLLTSYIIYALGWVSFPQFIGLFVLAYGLSMLTSLTYLSRLTRLNFRHDKSFLTPELKRTFGRYTLLAFLATVGTTLAGRMDLLLLAFVDRDGLASVAVFTVAFFMVSIVEGPTRAIIGIATARIASVMKHKDYARTRLIYEQVSFYQLLTSLIIFLGIWCNMDNILSIMPAGASYLESKNTFLFLGLAKLVEVTFTASHPIVSCSPYYHWNLYYTLSLIIVALIANLFLIPIFGTMGAAMSTLITAIVGYGLQQGLLSWRLGIHPLSKRMLIVLPITLSMLLAHELLPDLGSPWLDMALRSVVLGVSALLAILPFGVIPEVREFVQNKYGLWR